jgi:hypothetical protein
VTADNRNENDDSKGREIYFGYDVGLCLSIQALHCRRTNDLSNLVSDFQRTGTEDWAGEKVASSITHRRVWPKSRLEEETFASGMAALRP